MDTIISGGVSTAQNGFLFTRERSKNFMDKKLRVYYVHSNNFKCCTVEGVSFQLLCSAPFLYEYRKDVRVCMVN